MLRRGCRVARSIGVTSSSFGPASAVFESKWSRKQNQLNFHVNLWPKSESRQLSDASIADAVGVVHPKIMKSLSSDGSRWRERFSLHFPCRSHDFWTKTNYLVNDKVVIGWKCFAPRSKFLVWCSTWRHKLRDNCSLINREGKLKRFSRQHKIN